VLGFGKMTTPGIEVVHFMLAGGLSVRVYAKARHRGSPSLVVSVITHARQGRILGERCRGLIDGRLRDIAHATRESGSWVTPAQPGLLSKKKKKKKFITRKVSDLP
jgi:hypothetical protein